MAKYVIAFTILFLLALEKKCIFQHIFVMSLPNPRHEVAQHIQPNEYHRLKRGNPHSIYSSQHLRPKSSKHRHNKHNHSSSNRYHNGNHQSDRDSYIERKEHLVEHLRRHPIHQIENLQQNRDHYQRRTRSSSNIHLRRMPHPWTQLLLDEEKMIGDEPAISNEENDEIPFDKNSSQNDESYANSLDSIEMLSDISENDSLNHHRSVYRCPKCESAHKVEHITEEELTRLRIEFVKSQILEKLRLKERPNVSAIELPEPIQEGITIDQNDENTKNKELDDYYARTSRKCIFLERETRECERTGIQPSMCFSFKINDADAEGFDVNTAVLWIFKNKVKRKSMTFRNNSSNALRSQETIVVSEVQQPVDSTFRPMVKTIAIQTVHDQGKWLTIDIEWPIKRWFGNHDLSHLIQISCESCDIKAIEDMISVNKNYRPFIMINTQNRRRSSRQKRGINCTDGVTECCREKLYISFDEIGWGDWIIQPRGYDAYFCRGSCSSVASITQSSSHHSSFLQKVVAMSRNKGREPLELIPCCTAKQYSSLQLFFMDSNNTATQKTFPNMVVESCGCR